MKQNSKRTIKEKVWTMQQVLTAVRTVYIEDSHDDDWGVAVVYKNQFIPALKAKLYDAYDPHPKTKRIKK